jgi:ribose 5-phosphate isomerase
VRFPEIHDQLERDIKAVPGVIESGLFIRPAVELIVAGI